MKRIVNFVLLWMALLAFFSCKKESQSQGNVPVVKLREDKLRVSRTNVRMVAELTEFDGLEIIDKGFVYGMEELLQDTVICDNNPPYFFTTVSGLQENTTYYYRAFASNSVGVGWTETMSFVTEYNDLPTVETKDVVVTDNSARIEGRVIDDGGSSILAYGVCWGMGPNPTIDDSLVFGSTVMGVFTCIISGLDCGIPYYVRTYATNNKGTVYGEQREFSIERMPITVNNVDFNMVWVQGGTFRMGAQQDNPNEDNYDEEAYYDESPVHEVTLDSYYIGETEVTQQLWKAVMGSNPSYWKYNFNPVEQVSWDDIVNEFLPRLNALTGYEFRLPTEAEWEYAARGGGKSRDYKYSGSNNIDAVAYYYENSFRQPHVVKQKQPNELGLYDMSGNVCEWCCDWYGDYENIPSSNPQGPASGRYRVHRGGSCISEVGRLCGTTSRDCNVCQLSKQWIGFRLVLSSE